MRTRIFGVGLTLVLALFIGLIGARISTAELPPRPNFNPDNQGPFEPPLRPTLPPESRNPAFVTVAQKPEPITVAPPGSEIRVTLTIQSRGEGEVSDAEVFVPLDPNLVQLVDIRFSRSNMWVSAVSPELIRFRTGPLAHSDDRVQATLRLAVQPGAPDGTRLLQPVLIEWDNREGGYERGQSNQPPLVALFATPPDPGFVGLDEGRVAPIYGMEISTEASSMQFSSAVFSPGEPVALWLNLPSGATEELGSITANAAGQISFSHDTSRLPPGSYGMVASGVWSRVQAIGPFQR